MIHDNKHPDFPVDWNDLFGRIGDESIIVEFSHSFVRNAEKLMISLRDAIAAGDPEQIELYAHAMKGSASNIGAIPLAKVAWQLERAAAEKHIETAGDWFDKITAEFEILVALLRQPDWIQQSKDALLTMSA